MEFEVILVKVLEKDFLHFIYRLMSGMFRRNILSGPQTCVGIGVVNDKIIVSKY
jgi:hypothetical protein